MQIYAKNNKKNIYKNINITIYKVYINKIINQKDALGLVPICKSLFLKGAVDRKI